MSPATLLLLGLVLVWAFESGRIPAIIAVLTH